jgi:predicted transcriptional regulator
VNQEPTESEIVTTPDASADLLANSFGDYVQILWRRIKSGESGALPVIVGLIAIVIFFWVKSDSFMTARNLVNLMEQSAFIITLGMAEIFVLLLGDIDLAAGYTAGCGAVIALWMLAVGDPWWAAVIVALLATAAYGALQGIIVAKLNLPSFVVTLAGQLFLSGAIITLINSTGGIGTGGTISGAGRYLKEISDGRVRVIGADPEGSVYSGGSGRPYLVEGVGEDIWPATYDRAICDEVIAVTDAESFRMTRRLAREEALLVGGSSGLAVVAGLQAAHGAGPDDVIVVLLPDGGRGYLSKIFNDDWMADYGFLSAQTDEPLVSDVLARKEREIPEFVHAHPGETVAQAIALLREYDVSQLPVVNEEPPVAAAEVVGSIVERDLLDALITRRARPDDPISGHMSPPLPTVGSGETVSSVVHALEGAGAAVVFVDGKPAGLLTRQDLLTFLAGSALS